MVVVKVALVELAVPGGDVGGGDGRNGCSYGSDGNCNS